MYVFLWVFTSRACVLLLVKSVHYWIPTKAVVYLSETAGFIQRYNFVNTNIDFEYSKALKRECFVHSKQVLSKA